ncbi:MAG: pyridoxamine 5'-phosphate oxidase [Piscirickettsiaceae bacterium CG_4_9_14_3_um_filter_43_564]|nr:pyridoxamine 5'-phosphate oxidase [Thiomicrospira sp.]OIP96035.1 MAG: pyridoxamine 5'-phosphate oxidase [Thiomicrospira sp. CG2_30_44_34]PIQ06022.1 MAG: pyridoxamine 5'-phosphate oxidase [Piscirickettsiaceae bacterium CG18_big_fil_WC_8_21_14_2_50_44_103]PIU38175.1 MAG: pyridoxamine 5'-phosphate oxidase [Piscirickettsiaceae bacterium CG07_land_8_20_14_0_80_44_28]PIW58793.1 MAG: pyridoxamine 5'-phosphate oxidase [Piscirickettsiaceae bacterium CG12_big_fil_rev_8_21_14_0_65_44_934]PIW78646.1 MA
MSEATFLDLAELRQRYLKGGLDEDNTAENPFKQFEIWFKQAQEADLLEPNAMSLSTVDAQGQPSLRTVLLKQFDTDGFVFFTNYQSEKSKQIMQNPRVALLFPWLALERQVKVLGKAEKISLAQSMKYFASRPKGSQIGAWVSQQSQVVSSKQVLLSQFEKMKQKFQSGEVPFPDFWGGYRVVPHQIEFWQGGDNRLHDRICYDRKAGENRWLKQRLAP